ncbi:MAG: GGDEF domain-containing protein [Fervidobacterium sp.]
MDSNDCLDTYLNWDIFDSNLSGPIFILLADHNGNILKCTNNTPRYIARRDNIFKAFNGLEVFFKLDKRKLVDQVFDFSEDTPEKVRVVPVKHPKGIIVFGEIVTQKFLVDEYIAERLETLSMYLEFAPVFFIVLNKDGNVEYINSYALNKTGYDFQEVIGRNWFEMFIPEERRKEIQNVFNRIMAGNIEILETYENEILTKDRKQIVILWENKLVTKNGKPAGSISVGVDVTNEKIRDFEEELIISMLSAFLENNYQEAIKKISSTLKNKCNIKSAYAKIISSENSTTINFLESEENEALQTIEEINKSEDKVVQITIKYDKLPKYTSQQCLKSIINILFSFADRIYYIQRLEEASFKDPLTNLYNRRYFMIMLKNEIRRVKRYNSESSVVMIDLDGLKSINDTLGHDKGDMAIKTLSQALISNTRSTDICARFGGDEFVLLLPHTSSDSAKIIIDRIRESVQKTSEQRKLEFEISFSAGITSIVTNDDEEGISVLKRADQLLYQAKRSGKNKNIIG